MTPRTTLERRVAEYYAGEPSLRAPDRVLLAALATIDTTPQRRGIFAPWRFLQMPTYAKLAAAVAVIAVIAFGAWQLVPGPGPGPGGPVATPLPSQSPTPAPSRASAPTTPPYESGDLTEPFTSDIHGLSLSYPEGWSAQAATEPWTTDTFVEFLGPQADFFFDPQKDSGHLFLQAASRPLADASFDSWSAAVLGTLDGGCTETKPIVVDDADGLIGCQVVLVSRGGRGYLFALYTSGDDANLRTFDAESWLEKLMTTVQLRPGTAIDS